jgi:putative membrane protein
MRLLINAATLLLIAVLFPKIYLVDRSLVSLLLMAAVLGLLNAFVKPIIQVLTLHFIFVSYGLVVILINALILYLLAFLFPAHFAVSSVFAALAGGAIIGLLGSLLESLLGVTPPVVGDRYPEVRTQLKQEQEGGMKELLMRPLSGPAPEALPHAPDTAAVAIAESTAEAAGSLAQAAEIPVETGASDPSAQAAAGGEA